MKYYDVETKEYCAEQDVGNTRIPFSNGALIDVFDRTANGEVFDVDNLDLPSFFDKELIRKTLLYIELKRLNRIGGNEERINEIQAILNPPEEEEENDTETTD